MLRVRWQFAPDSDIVGLTLEPGDLDLETEKLAMERHSPLRRTIKACLINPLANYLPAALTRSILRFTKSELAAANWKDPGGWRSMVISYEGKPHKLADRVLVGSGTMPMALRNRRRLAAAVLAHLIDEAPAPNVHVLCLARAPATSSPTP